MKKVLLFGATGNLGREILRELMRRSYDVVAVVRNEAKAKLLSSITTNCVVADVGDQRALHHICSNQDIVISALGKSVSLKDKSKPTFYDVDFCANAAILEEAQKSGVQKFVYVSAFHAERYPHLEYFRVHHEFSELLKKSGIDYSIVKPPAIFSAFIDMVEMAKKGQLFHLGKGDKKTNPIYEGDLAEVVVDSIHQSNCVVEAGGKTIYSRRQLNELVQAAINKKKKVRTMPLELLKMSLPLVKLFDKNAYDKFAFFTEVIQHNTIAPQIGEMSFEEYLSKKISF